MANETTYVGVDPSLTSTGWAVMRNGSIVDYGRIKSKGKKNANLSEQYDRMEDIVDRLLGAVDCNVLKLPADVVVAMEAPAINSRFGRVHQRYGLWWLMYSSFRSLCVREIMDIPPTTLKKYFTGNGRAEKEDMIREARKRIGPSHDPNDDEADAIALAYWAANLDEQ